MRGPTVAYNGQDLVIGSSTDFTFVNANGCDSIVTVGITGLEVFASDLALETCDGTTASYQGQDLPIGSSTDFTLIAINGCDSIVTVSVSGVAVITNAIALETCEGTEASYSGQSLAIGSSTDFTFTSTNGCDSIVTVTVSGIDNFTSSLNLSGL